MAPIKEKVYKDLGNIKISLMQKFFFLAYGKKYVVKNIAGSKMKLGVFDKGISFDLLSKGIREKKAMQYFQTIIKKGDVILDIGANIGYYALMESRKVGKNGIVYAIEPEKNNYKRLKENIALNNYKNILTYNLAIGDQNKKTKLFVHPTESNLHSLFLTRIHKKDIYQITNVVTVDNFLKNKRIPQIIRMDVEGFEYAIIKGMKNTLKKKTPLIMFIEVHNSFMGPKRSLKLFDTLVKEGFKTEKIVFDTGEGILTPKYLRIGYKRFKKRMEKYKDNPEKGFREELKEGKFNYEVILRR